MIEEASKKHSELEDEEPTTFREAWDHPDETKRQKWREAICKEFGDIIKRGVWRKINKSQMPTRRRCVKRKWIFKIKRNGVYRARLVACGYSQIPGLDFTEIPYSPVINDITYRLLILLSITNGWTNVIINVETVFLH